MNYGLHEKWNGTALSRFILFSLFILLVVFKIAKANVPINYSKIMIAVDPVQNCKYGKKTIYTTFDITSNENIQK